MHPDEKRLYDEVNTAGCAIEVGVPRRKRESRNVQRNRLLESMIRHGAYILRSLADLCELEAEKISEDIDSEKVEEEIEKLEDRLKELRAR